MKILLTGAAGQLGQALRQQVPAGVELIATSRSGGDGLLALDLTEAEACRAAIRDHRPDWVLNAGAYTAVDKAESEPELALAVNGGAPRAFAEALLETGGRLLQVSTDFVFNGSQGSPYRPEQARDPLGRLWPHQGRRRGSSGAGAGRQRPGRDFAHQLGDGAGGQELCPHHAAAAPGAPADRRGGRPGGLPHQHPYLGAGISEPVLHWSDAGAASWFDVAVAVGELAQELGLLEQPALVNPLTTADYPLPAQRPSYSLLDCSATRQALDLPALHWRQALRQLLEAVA